MADDSWIQFDQHSEKRSRASLTCVNCHSRKVKCDLQRRRARGLLGCSRCTSASIACTPRHGKRERSRMLRSAPRNNPLASPGEPGRSHEYNGWHNHELAAASTLQTLPNLGSQRFPGLPRMEPASLSDAAPVVMAPSDITSNEPAVAAIPDKFGSTASGNTAVDPGFLHVYRLEHENIARRQTSSISKQPAPIEGFQAGLQESFLETYFTHCYAWCPVIDKPVTKSIQSPLLSEALALAGSNIRPPLVPCDGPATYYDRARRKFYEDEEPSLITSLQAVSLFYWWAPQTPTTVHRHSSWWWTSVIIRHCQQAGFHRESVADRHKRTAVRGLRRRIFWTVFARERLTAMCQGKPSIIDLDDCNIPHVSMEDFPAAIFEPEKAKAKTFIYWVRLCAIIGRIAKYLSRQSGSASPAFPIHLAKELSEWSSSLPANLQLPISSPSTSNFNLDTHQLHLPYLAVIIVLYLKRSTQLAVPTASPPAIVAASCVARIMKDLLLRGEMRGLMPITCWYCGMAFMPLLQAANTVELSAHASAELDVLKAAIKQLKTMWDTANLFDEGFERLTATLKTSGTRVAVADQTAATEATMFAEKAMQDSFDYKKLFPFVTADTSPVCSGVFAQEVTQFSYFANDGNEPMLNFQSAFDDLNSWLDFDINFPFQPGDMDYNLDTASHLS